MPWVAVNSPASQWAMTAHQRTYFNSFFVDDDYVEDEEWTLSNEPAGDWELTA